MIQRAGKRLIPEAPADIKAARFIVKLSRASGFEPRRTKESGSLERQQALRVESVYVPDVYSEGF